MFLRNPSQRSFSNEQLDQRLRAGLICHLIDGGAGDRWFDRSGRARNGTISGATWDLGFEGKRNALGFDGTNDYVDFGNASNPLIPATSDWSFSAWIYPTNTSEKRIFSQYLADVNNGRIIIRINSSNLWELFLGSSDGGALGTVFVTSTATAVTNQWTHLTATRNGNFFALYINGVRVGSNTDGSTRTILQTGNLLACSGTHISTYNSTLANFLGGRIDDVRVYSRGLSAAEVALLASPSFSPVIQPYRFFGKLSAGGGGSRLKTYNAITNARLKTWNAITNARIKTLNGISNQ